MSTFDTDAFLGETTNTALDTTIPPVPEGDYTATISKVEIRETKASPMMDISWVIDDMTGDVQAVTNMKTNTVRQSLFLDTTPGGKIDYSKGKNVALGRVRDAVHQNVAGQAWNPLSLVGAGPATVHVSHRTYEGNTYAEIKRVASQ